MHVLGSFPYPVLRGIHYDHRDLSKLSNEMIKHLNTGILIFFFAQL